MKILKFFAVSTFVAVGIFVGQASLQAQQPTKKIVQGPLAEFPLKLWEKLTSELKRDKIAQALTELPTNEVTFAVEGYDQKIFNLSKTQVSACASKIYGKTTAIGFTLHNKSDKPIWVGLINGSNVMLSNTAMAAHDGGRAASFISTNKPSTVLIWDVDPRQITYAGTNNKPIITPAPKYTYDIKSSKTVYVAWDGTQLIPSEGTPICKGMTHTGFSLNNNVMQSDIVKK